MRTIVLGLGNPILRDDGIGPRIVYELQKQIVDPDIMLLEASLAGMDLMETLVGYDRAIIIDAIRTGGGKPGTIYQLTPDDLPPQRTDLTSQHQLGLLNALQLGKELSQPMPKKIVIIAVEAEDVHTFSEKLTPLVEQAVSQVVGIVLSELGLAR
jgi:hydrogenase maturation protease